MAETTSDELLGLFDSAPLNARYWTSFVVMSGVLVLDFFDFFLIAFVMSVIGPEWKLTYGQGALILYGAGVGAIAGALVSGSLGDVFGRKAQTVIGWRGVAMTGFIAVVVGLLVWALVPESVRWLAAKGRFAEARAGVAKQLGLPLASVPLPTVRPAAQPRASLTELFSVNPRLFWQTLLIWGGSASAVYGYYLWGPTIVALALQVEPAQAAKYFVYVSASGVTGKILVSLIASHMGRRSLGIVFGFVSAVLLVLAGYFSGALVGGFPVFILFIAASAFFAEGGFSNLAPYTVEQYGVNLGSRSSGLGQAANGVGKILGPLALALLAGSDNIIAPKATAAAVFPAFVFLGATMLAVALAFVFLGVETHGRALSLGHEAPARR